MRTRSGAPDTPKTLTSALIGVGAGTGLAWLTWPHAGAAEWQAYAAGAGVLVAGLSGTDGFTRINALARSYERRKRAQKPGSEYGAAAFMTAREARKLGFDKPSSGVLGIFDDGTVAFVDPVHAFILAPAGAGKTTTWVTNRLGLCTDSLYVSDLKGEIACTTASMRADKLGQKVVILNPAELWRDRLGASAHINPIRQIELDLRERPADALATAVAYSKQLIPMPPTTNNQVFYIAARRELDFAMLYVAARGDPRRADLCEVARIIINPEAFDAALVEALAMTDVLNEELADRALAIAEMRENEPKLFNNCHVSAVQAMQPFSRAGLAAKMMSAAEGEPFDPIEMKTGKVTVYMVIDPSRLAELAPVAGLITQYVLLRLTRAANKARVRLLLDEATALKVEGLAEAFTTLRGFGIGVDFIAQSLSEIERAYGRQSMETFVNQSELKMAIGPMGDFRSAELWSKMLGSTGVVTSSFGLGQRLADDVQQSHAATSRPLMRPEELMQLPRDQVIAVLNGRQPLKLSRLTYAEIAPIKHWIDENPLEGKPLKARTRVRLRG